MSQIIFRKVADLKHEQALDEMQQNQPPQEFSQDHIVRRLISKFRKPSDAGVSLASLAPTSSQTLQVPTHAKAICGAETDTQAPTSATANTPAATSSTTGQPSTTMRSLAAGRGRWSQLVASAAAGAGAGASALSSFHTTPTSHSSQPTTQLSATRALLDIGAEQTETNSMRSSSDGRCDDEMDENYFKPGGKGHQALLDNMDKK